MEKGKVIKVSKKISKEALDLRGKDIRGKDGIEYAINNTTDLCYAMAFQEYPREGTLSYKVDVYVIKPGTLLPKTIVNDAYWNSVLRECNESLGSHIEVRITIL